MTKILKINKLKNYIDILREKTFHKWYSDIDLNEVKKGLTIIYDSEKEGETLPDHQLVAIIHYTKPKVIIYGYHVSKYGQKTQTSQTAEVTVNLFAVEKIENKDEDGNILHTAYALLLIMPYTTNDRQFFRIERLHRHNHKSFDYLITPENIRKLDEKFVDVDY
jgi:hypothetical protein